MVNQVPLLGRQRECQVLKRLLESARESRGGALAVYGEPGVGKTALLDYAARAASDFRVAQVAGVEGEMELAYAALYQLCTPALDLRDRLPEPQRKALEVALGLSSGQPPNQLLVGLAVLNLLAETAQDRPVLCTVDDAQWLDLASTAVLAFVSRRLLAEKMAVIFAAREDIAGLAGLAELRVGPLGHRDARALLESALQARLDERVLERIVAETRGNPLALLELPRGLSPAQLAGGFAWPAAQPLSAQIEASFISRLAKLPADTRRFLLVAAADPTGDSGLQWRAAHFLGISAPTQPTADLDGLVGFDSGVSFRHPLVRSAVYRHAEAKDRTEVHNALAEATDPDIDPDRRAWHQALATLTPDEGVAGDLERSAARAQARGGFAAAAAFLERATALTLDPARHAARALAAAEAKQQAGAPDDALALAATAEAGPLSEIQQAQVDVLRARNSFTAERGREAPRLLLTAAQRLEPLDDSAAREVYLDALTAAIFAGRLGGSVDTREVAVAAAAAHRTEPSPRAADLLLQGISALVVEGAGSGAPALRKALRAFNQDEVWSAQGLRWLWLAGRAAGYIWDYDSWDDLTRKQVHLARGSGALTVLPLTLSTRAGVELYAGNLAEASDLVAEADVVAEATDGQSAPYGALALAAFRGAEPDASRLIEATRADFLARGEGAGITLANWATALLHNGLARYDIALGAAERAAEDPRELWLSPWALVELIEAAIRTGQREGAADAFNVLRETTAAGDTPWAHGVEARSRALLAEDDAADKLYRQAIESLAATRLGVDLARTHLLYGEWLRREQRRSTARTELRTAHELFCDFGMRAFAERARVELEATGERARKRNVETPFDLTPQESQISRLVAEGHANKDIASQLFISPNTVEYHLRKIFRKLDVKSRTQLANRMRDGLSDSR